MKTPALIISEALQAIPAPLRKGLLIVFALAVVGVYIAQALDVSWDYDKINKVFGIIGGYLSVQSAANVNTKPPGEAGLLDGVDPVEYQE